MPDLDVSFMVADPMFADVFSLRRQNEVISKKGRTQIIPQTFPDLIGVVTQMDPSDLMRAPDGEMVPRCIMLCTSFAVRGAVEGYQPDIIIWDGLEYLVTSVLPYSRFGGGTYEVVAEFNQAMVGQAPAPAPMPTPPPTPAPTPAPGP